MKKLTFIFLSGIGCLSAQLPSYSWHANMGGYFQDEVKSLVVDGSGNTYVAGLFSGTVDFDPGPGTNNIQCNGGTDIFVMKLDPNGNVLWVKDFGSNSSIYEEGANSIALDASNNVIVTGYFKGMIDFDPGPAVYNMSAGGGIGYGTNQVFILKLTSNGDFVWARTPGASNGNSGHSITTDASGNIYTVGSFRSQMWLDFENTDSSVTSLGGEDIFIQKMDANGNYIWGHVIGGSNDQHPTQVVEKNGFVYISGYYEDSADFNPQAGVTLLTGGMEDSPNGFVMRLSTAGNFDWAGSIGMPGYSIAPATSLTVDNADNVYVVGDCRGYMDFDPGAGSAMDTTFNLSFYVVKLNSSGTYIWHRVLETNVNNSYDNHCTYISNDANNTIFITGYFSDSTDFDPGAGVHYMYATGDHDMFIDKLDENGNFIWSTNMGGNNPYTDLDVINCLEVVNDEIYLAGSFANIMDCDPGSNTVNITSNGWADILIMKLGQNNTGMEQHASKQVSVVVYPNPSADMLWIKADQIVLGSQVKVEVTDITGKIIYSVQDTYNGSYTMDVTDYISGIYIISVYSDQNRFTGKLIKQ